MQIGTRLLNRAEAQPRPDRQSADRHGADDRRSADLSAAVQPYGPDGTLLAVVPIPGTGTSLAIVGYQFRPAIG